MFDVNNVDYGLLDGGRVDIGKVINETTVMVRWALTEEWFECPIVELTVFEQRYVD